jgi:uncharacterized protein (TIGR04255 family)
MEYMAEAKKLVVNTMSITYGAPPLIEATCAITYSEGVNWDPTVPGLFFEKIREEFPTIYKRSAPICKVVSEESEIEVGKINRTSFMSPNKSMEVSIYENNLIVRALRPYQSWNNFKRAIIDCNRALNGIIGGKECRVSFHYSNIITSDGQNIYDTENIADLFNIKPTLGSRLPGEFSDFIVGCEFTNTDDNIVSRMTLTTIAEEAENKRSYMLYIGLNSKKPMEQSKIPEWIEKAHDEIYALFEGTITDQLKERFKPVIR